MPCAAGLTTVTRPDIRHCKLTSALSCRCVCVSVRVCTCTRVCVWALAGPEPLCGRCAPVLSVPVCQTLSPASLWGSDEPKSSSSVCCYLFLRPLCALSASEARRCPGCCSGFRSPGRVAAGAPSGEALSGMPSCRVPSKGRRGWPRPSPCAFGTPFSQQMRGQGSPRPGPGVLSRPSLRTLSPALTPFLTEHSLRARRL